MGVLASCASPPADDATSGDDALSYGARAQCSSDSPTNGRCLAEAEVVRLLRTAGFPERIVPAMVCTAKWESGFYERAAHKNGNQSTDRGVFQINSIHVGEKGCPSNAEGFFNAQNNANCALVVYKGQQKNSSDPLAGVSNAWVAYRAHKTECANYKLPAALATPVASATASPNGTTVVDAGPPPADGNDATGGDAPPGGGDATAAGSCFAGTLGQSLPQGGCYQRKQDGVWFQCHAGLWYRSVTDDGDGNMSGPYGACDPSFPLEP